MEDCIAVEDGIKLVLFEFLGFGVGAPWTAACGWGSAFQETWAVNCLEEVADLDVAPLGSRY